MKHYLLLVVMLITGMQQVFADASLIAILNHQGEIKTFTTAMAFKDAVAGAVDGDIITLSSGSFQAADITKSITVRGAGMGYPELGGTANPTYITGNMTVNCPTEDSNVTLEGLYFNGVVKMSKADKITALKCYFNQFAIERSNTSIKVVINDLNMIHCIIPYFKAETSSSFMDKLNLKCINSVIYCSDYSGIGTPAAHANMSFDNCFIQASSVYGGTILNSVINFKTSNGNSSYVNASAILTNCILSNCNKFQAANLDSNKFINATEEEIFPNGLYELNDELKQFTGTDGGQVGIYGGSLPFSPVTTNLKITKFNVAAKTTADGKLPIEIEVNAN